MPAVNAPASAASEPPSVTVVVIAHGSRTEAANRAHRELAAHLEARLEHPVAAAFLELAPPSIPEAITAAVDSGTRTVVVVPYFLHPGRHQSEDIPRLVNEARRAHPDADVRLLDLFGADPGLVELLSAQVRGALADGSK